MKVTGSTVLNAPRSRVWDALNDPAVLVRTLPGCQRLEQVGPDEYRATMNAGVASIKGTFSGEVKLTDQVENETFVMHASGAGAPGTVDAQVRVTLADSDGDSTRLDYDADAAVGGMIGGVGQRMLASAAKRTAGEFFTAVDDVLCGRVPVAEVPPAAAAAAAGQAPPAAVPEAAPAPAVYTAPPRGRPAAPVAVVLGAAVVGALIALVGVLVGWLIAG